MAFVPPLAAARIAEHYGVSEVVILARAPQTEGLIVVPHGVDPDHAKAAHSMASSVRAHLSEAGSALLNTGIEVLGVGRHAQSDRVLLLHLSRPCSDDAMRALSGFLRSVG